MGTSDPTGSITVQYNLPGVPAALDDNAPPQREVNIPRQLGPVELVREIGRGGMGSVWLGHDRILKRDVAVKFLLNSATDGAGDGDKALNTFLDGARAAAAVRHPGLTAILHADVVQGVPYLVMEYVRGPSFDEVLRTVGPLTLEETLAVLGCVHELISELHARGIVHRDIKPANILLNAQGELFVTDFGLACNRPAVVDGRTVHGPGLAGTAAYMAPEMFDGVISPRSDVYALGITAYELLAGRAPFAGSLYELRRQHREEPLPVQPLLERGISEPVIGVLERATNKNAMFRLKTARHVYMAMKQAAGEETPTPPGDVLAKLMNRYAQMRSGSTQGIDLTPAPSSSYTERLTELAEERRTRETERVRPGAPKKQPMPSRGLGVEITCIGCGHNLREIPAEGRCTECNLPVRESLASDRLIFADVAWLRRAAMGCRVLWWTGVVYFFLFFAAVPVDYYLSSDTFDSVWFVLDMILWGGPFTGQMLIVVGGRLAWPARLAAITTLLVIASVATAELILVAGLKLIHAVEGAPMFVAIASLLLCLSLLAKQVPDTKLRRLGLMLSLLVIAMSMTYWIDHWVSSRTGRMPLMGSLWGGALFVMLLLAAYFGPIWYFGRFRAMLLRVAEGHVDLKQW